MNRLLLKLTAVFSAVSLLCACADKGKGSSVIEEVTEPEPVIISAPEDKQYIFTDNSPVFSLDKLFYPASISVELKTVSEAEIYYTQDGSEPDKTDTLYTEPLLYECEDSKYPTAHTIKAKAYYPDGTESDVSVHTYFSAVGVDERFSEYVFSISGEPSVLTEGPDGIFYGKNYEQRGRESEREVYLSAWDSFGNQILGQYCGVRIYGAGSRGNTVKSMKLYARKSYSSGVGKFHTDIFETPVEDGSGNIISEYDKLVLRNAGNDYQFAFIRDELCQTLAQQAGFTDYEAVMPAVCYLNGEYYGLLWLHESYCDDYFKEKYPNETAMGEFVIAEGTDAEKNVDEEEEEPVYSQEFNEQYEYFASANLTDASEYEKLNQFMDTENYLDYFAFNIYINNRDWPQNNFKCYKYVSAEGESFEESVYDGRWRFLLHDTDYSLGMYEQAEVQARYNNLKRILDENSDRYSPLFANMMNRSDCREYFRNKMYELAEGALDGENIKAVLDTLNGSRYFEQMKYYGHLDNLRKEGDRSIWTAGGHLNGQLKIINEFANRREEYILKYTDECLGKYEEETAETSQQESS